MAQKPLLLKDYLELDCELGFQCASAGASTVRCLINAELRRCSSAGDDGRRLVRSRPVNALTKISAAISAVKLLSFPSISSSSSDARASSGVRLSKSWSHKIKGSFWRMKRSAAAATRRTEEVEEKSKAVKRVRDIVRLASLDEDVIKPRRSFSLPSPVIVSSRSSLSEITVSSKSGSSPRLSVSSSDLDVEVSASVSPACETGAEVAVATGKPAPKEMEGNEMESSDGRQTEEEEKDQLSPVSVMDFPFEEDDNSLAFCETLAAVERTKMQVLQKIRRFESLAELVDPIDLRERFDEEAAYRESTSEDRREEDGHCAAEAWNLPVQLRSNCHVNMLDGATEKLPLDFFVQRPASVDVVDHHPPLRSEEIDWVRGNSHLVQDEWLYGDAVLREMERNGRWRCFEEEEKELGIELERALLARLLEELMTDVLSL